MIKRFFSIAIILFLSCSLRAQVNLSGNWKGAVTISKMDLKMVVKFTVRNDSLKGVIDIPEQHAKNLELKDISYKHPKINFNLETSASIAYFNGEVFGDSIGGIFSQDVYQGTFYLNRTEEVIKEEVKEKLPYKEEEVTFKNGENLFAGTLTIPEHSGKHPAVVMITGSGPQNRDEEILGFKPFRIIADYLTRNGIAVLRYDDRGVGDSKGKSVNESTTDEFSYDVIEAVKYLQSRSDINPKQIGLCGHSEGGIVAPLVASKFKDIAFIICIAGTGVTGGEILLEQSRLIAKADSSSDEDININLEQMKMLIDVAIKNTGWDEATASLKDVILKYFDKIISEEERKTIYDRDVYAQNLAKTQVNVFKSEWMRYFISYNPVPALEKVKCPVLMFFGGKDLQVPVKQNEKPMVDALKKGGNKDYTVKTFADANHLFQTATTGSPTEYAKLPKEFTDGFLDFMKDWVLKRVTVVK